MVQSIEKLNFDPKQSFLELVSDGSWTTHSEGLKLTSTSGTAVVAVPESAIECNREESNCKCGTPRATDRIIGGTVVEPKNKYPWIAQLIVKDQETHEDPRFDSNCAATLINENWAVTAAHCVYDTTNYKPYPAPMISLIFDQPNKKLKSVDSKRHYVKDVIIHPDFDYTPLDYDYDYGYLEDDSEEGSEEDPDYLDYPDLATEQPLLDIWRVRSDIALVQLS